MAVASDRWTCAKCAVSVGRIDGGPTRLPASWTESVDGIFCLACSRTRASEAAVATAVGISSGERAQIRRRALIEFEIGRDPEASNRTIAHACRTSSAAVAAVRKSSP
jgi:hypothetical protein